MNANSKDHLIFDGFSITVTISSTNLVILFHHFISESANESTEFEVMFLAKKDRVSALYS